MRFVFSNAYLIYHPDSVKHVLQENHRNYNKDVLTYRLFRPFLGMGLLTNDGDSWLHQRRLIQPALHRKRLAAYGTLMTGTTTTLLERWHARADGDAPLEITEEMMSLTFGIVGKALFSVDLSQETSTVGHAVTRLVKLIGDYIYTPFPPLSIPTSRNRRMLAAQREIDEVVKSIIERRRQQNIDTGDLLSMLLLARDEETGQGMSDQQVHDEVITLLNERQQTKWIVFGLSATILLAIVWNLPAFLFPSFARPGTLYDLTLAAFNIFLLLPTILCIAIAILRYRLWDIDILINRTLVYGSLTAILGLVYFASVIALQVLLSGFTGHISTGSQSPIVLVASTLGIVALFQPLRGRLQTFIDRRFYRSKYDAARILASFSMTMSHEVDLNKLKADLLAVVQETMQPTHVSLWVGDSEPSKGRNTHLLPEIDEEKN